MKIALIAMTGMRICDEALRELGLTLPGFVERSKVLASLPSLGLLTVAGMTPKGHDLEYLEVADIEALEALPDGFDLVALSSYSAQIGEAYELARRYKAMGVPTVMGGPHVSCLPDEAAQNCDAVVIGEGEPHWRAILRDCQAGRLQSFYGSLNAEFDLKDAPMPAFELLDISKYNRLLVQTSRGCPHRCEFCASSVLIAGKYKQKPAEKVLAEIDKIRDMWKRPFIEFADDNSLVNRKYWKALLPELKKRKIRWFVETDISFSKDEELLRLMRESGCAQVLIGLESPLKADLEALELRDDWKSKQWPRYKDAIRSIQSHGITVNGCFVLGLDSHGPEVFDAVFDFVKETELYDVQITIQTPFPGTPLYARLKREKRILEDEAWNKCTLFDVNYEPKHMSPEALAKGFRELYLKLYSEDFTRWRKNTFKKHLRAQLRKSGTE